MSSPVEQEYWPELLERLAECSVAALASEYSLEPAELDAALAATSGDRPVQQELWWPEVLREHEHGSLRQLARRFGTNPRRLRRGLARCAVRVGGATVTEAGVLNLEPFRERLGQEPDRTLAAEAGVTLEAIKGERRRLGIEPYRMKPDVEEWGGKPPTKRDKPRPRRRWQDAPEPVIIRRAGNGREASAEPEQDLVAEPGPTVERKARPLLSGFRGVGLGGPGHTDEPSRSTPEGLRGLSHQRPAGTAEPEVVDSPEVQREQRGRRRIVRPPTPEEERREAGESAEVFGRLPRLGVKAPVRMVDPDQFAAAEVEPPAVGPKPKARRARPTAVSKPEPAPSAVAAKPKARKARPTAVSEPEPTPPAERSPAPRIVQPAPVTKQQSAQLEAPPTPPEAPEPPPTSEPGSFAWQVQVPGREDPMLVLADDLNAALSLASEHLGGADLTGAKAWRLGEVLREGND